jgi:hypothetical protein
MKFALWKEKTARTGRSERFAKRYSSAATGSEESSAFPGMNGLHPVRSTSSGIAEWRRLTLRRESAPEAGLLEARQTVAPGGRRFPTRRRRFSQGKSGLRRGRGPQDAGEMPALALDRERG